MVGVHQRLSWMDITLMQVMSGHLAFLHGSYIHHSQMDYMEETPLYLSLIWEMKR